MPFAVGMCAIDHNKHIDSKEKLRSVKLQVPSNRCIEVERICDRDSLPDARVEREAREYLYQVDE
jgi:hypothetical protein